VLLAEDNPVNQEITRELLGFAGLQVDVADDGQQAVDLLQARRDDLVLMDMQMPGLDGLSASRRMRTLGHAVPIIALTVSAFEEDRRACQDAGMDDDLAKPVETGALHANLLHWLDGATAPAPAAV